MYVFTDFFRQQLFSNLNLMSAASVQVYFFPSYASFAPNDPRYTGLRTIADLQNQLGWGPALLPSVVQPVSTVNDALNSRYVIANQPFDNDTHWVDSQVVAAAVVLKTASPLAGVTDPIIFITDSPFGDVMRSVDKFGALPNSAALGQSSLFAWQMPAVGATQVLPQEGALTIYKAPPDYEYSHQQHAWLFPQRVNMIANPSFEGGVNHWRSNGALIRQTGGAPGGGFYEGRVTGTAPLILESNFFPTKLPMVTSDLWTVQAMLRGTGNVKIGMLSWESDFATTGVDWGPDTEVWPLPASGWLHVYAMRRIREGGTGMLRIECDGTDMVMDNLLVEPEWLNDWPYFDGSTTYGAPDDFSWYGGEGRQANGLGGEGATYSLWYNHRRAVVGRLFAWSIADDDFTVTDEEVESQGFVYKWVPAGVRVIPHMDVLTVGDPQSPVPAVTGSVLPYLTPGTPLGVEYTWAPTTLSLSGATGNYITALDAAPLDITGDLCLMAKITPKSWTPARGPTRRSSSKLGDVNDPFSYEMAVQGGGTPATCSSGGAPTGRTS